MAEEEERFSGGKKIIIARGKDKGKKSANLTPEEIDVMKKSIQ